MQEVIVKKWGNSIGIVLPKRILERKKIKLHEKIWIDIFKKSDLTDVFGSLKTDLPGQKFKDMIREGWY